MVLAPLYWPVEVVSGEDDSAAAIEMFAGFLVVTEQWYGDGWNCQIDYEVKFGLQTL